MAPSVNPSSPQAIDSSPVRSGPVHTPTTVSKLLPNVSAATNVSEAGVNEYHTVLRTAPNAHGGWGSPACSVASSVLTVSWYGSGPTTVADAKASLSGGTAPATGIGPTSASDSATKSDHRSERRVTAEPPSRDESRACRGLLG